MNLPKLIYIGGVPVEAELSGAVLLYRLLCEYPTDRILVVQPDFPPLGPRLPDVRYASFNDGVARWVPSTWPGVSRLLRPLAIGINVAWLGRKLVESARSFGAEAILTVTHGPFCLIAAAVAKRLQLPLYIISHDNWQDTIFADPPLLWHWQRQFRTAYATAAARLCVSPYMASYYEELYGAPGSVLLPCRAKEVSVYPEPPEVSDGRPFTIAYAGSFHVGYAESFRVLAHALEEFGGRLVMYSNLGPGNAVHLGLDSGGVCLYPTKPSQDQVANLRATADALVLVMEDKLNSRICFPSKLVDYTATGLPIIVLAPSDSSAAKWVDEEQGGAIVVDNSDHDGIGQAVRGLAADPALRRQLGEAAMAAGNRAFSYERVRDQFFSALQGRA